MPSFEFALACDSLMIGMVGYIFSSLLVASLASLIVTGYLRRYALKRCLMDMPNSRSSHAVPTPRGGGMAIVLVMISTVVALGWLGWLSHPVVWAILGGGGLVALVGWLDDHGHVAAHWRLGVHFVGAAWGLFWLGGLPPLPILNMTLDLGWLGHILALFYLVWLLNIYNFMDGIDGIAGVEAVTVGFGGALLAGLLLGGAAAWLPALLAAAVLGFLPWNFPRARIFMGDAGSGFVGLVLGLLSLQAASVAPDLLWGWLILLGAFIVDATLTLLRRLLRGERVHEAHRSHAYQHAARKLGSHVPVTTAVGMVNLLWLLPIALWVVVGSLPGVVGVVIAYLPLIGLALYWRAGESS